MADKFIMIGLDDENSKDIADVIGNKTCKRILDFLADRKEASEKDIADGLGMPLNTIEYNLKKLVKVGLIEKANNFFWSVKGKKIAMYKLANKNIIISTKTKINNFVPAIIVLGIWTFAIKILTDKFNKVNFDNSISKDFVEGVVQSSPSAAMDKVNYVSEEISRIPNNCLNFVQGFAADAWAWFLLGGLVVILTFLLWNQFKKMKGGFD